MRFLASILAALFLLLMQVPDASAQDTGSASPEAVTADQRQRIETLIQTIEDEGRRQELVDTLRTLLEVDAATTAAEETRDGILDQIVVALSGKLTELAGQATALIRAVERLPQLVEWVRQQATVPVLRQRWTDIWLSLAIVLGAGLAVRFAAVQLLRRWRTAASGAHPTTRLRAIGPFLVKLVLDILPLTLFAGACSIAIGLVAPTPSVRTVLLAGIEALFAAGLFSVAVRSMTSPHSRHLRLLPMTDETAAYFLIWMTRLAYVAAFGYFIWRAGFALGLSGGAEDALLFLTNLVFAGLAIVFILQNRTSFAEWLRGSGEVKLGPAGRTIGVARRRFAEVWHIFAIAYVVGAFLVDAIGVKGGLVWIGQATVLSILVLIAAQIAVAALRWALERAFSVGEDARRRFPTLQSRANRYLNVFRHVLDVTIAIVAVLVLLEVWGLGGVSWVGTELGGSIVAVFGSILLVILVSLVLWEVASTLIEHQLTRTDTDGRPIPLSGRARTLLPLLRNIILVALLTLSTLIVLSELGLNIAPLLAGAGVIGLAIGFGAQTLVKDVITGLFILIEDTISVGDVVDVGGHSGVVEGMTIRTIRLRDLAGAVHTIPFSTVASVTNMTKDFSFYVFDVGVSYRMNVDRVVEVLKSLGEEIRTDDVLGPDILEPLEIIGLDRFDESAVVIKARIKTKPIRQWAIGREFNRRMKQRFDEEGIEIPFTHRTLTLDAESAKLLRGGAKPAP